MIRKLIFQVFLGENENLVDHPIFTKSRLCWKIYCDNNGFEYAFFDKDNINKYLGEHKEFYYGLEFTWQRIDFIRYLILNQEGGIYIDMDIFPHVDKNIFELLDQPYIFNYWIDPKTGIREINNALMGVHPGDFDNLIKYSILETERCRAIPCYKVRKIRFMLHTTGVRMFKRWIKKNRWSYTPTIHDYVKDTMTCTWVNNFH